MRDRRDWLFDPFRVAATEAENLALRDSLHLPPAPPLRTDAPAGDVEEAPAADAPDRDAPPAAASAEGRPRLADLLTGMGGQRERGGGGDAWSSPDA